MGLGFYKTDLMTRFDYRYPVAFITSLGWKLLVSSDQASRMSHDFGQLPFVLPLEDAARTFLTNNAWPAGFQKVLLEQCANIPVRFFICDDSGSMYADDGMHLVCHGGVSKSLKCSRWTELCESLLFHLELAHIACAPSEFRLLNGLEPKFVGDKNLDPDSMGYRAVKKIFTDGSPKDRTPLCRHINAVVQYLQFHEQTLRGNNQVVSLIICTDGVSSDGDVTHAMRPLKNLPCMVVVRLCTDEDNVVAYWDKVEKDLEMQLDIVDDFFGEGDGVHQVNPWLNYGMPLQRLREFGVKVKELDLIDERLLSTEQMLKILSMIFDKPVKEIPPPDFDWATFEEWVNLQNRSVTHTYNPNTASKALEPWVNIKNLRNCYNPNAGGCCSIN